jgi:S1-C subfamily serine protease
VRTKLAALCALASLVPLGFVACSDDSSNSSSSTSSNNTTSQPAVSAAAGSSQPSGGSVTLDQLPTIVSQLTPSVVEIRTDQGLGSGVIWDSNGHIVTNNHVVAGASSWTVVLPTGRELPAKVLGTDPSTDIAVVTVDETGLPAMKQASNVPPEGTPVLAIGSPLGLENSSTFGIISGLRRSIPGGGESLVDLIQTDAPISPGNSGGALADLNGQLVGINVAFIPPSQSAVAIGFAVPITTVTFVVGQLETTGQVVHAFLGVNVVTLTPDLAQEFGLSATSGAVVRTVANGSPAAQAGIRPGDVIVSANGNKVSTAEDLIGAVREAKPGDTLQLQVLRQGTGDPQQVNVTLAERPSQ